MATALLGPIEKKVKRLTRYLSNDESVVHIKYNAMNISPQATQHIKITMMILLRSETDLLDEHRLKVSHEQQYLLIVMSLCVSAQVAPVLAASASHL